MTRVGAAWIKTREDGKQFISLNLFLSSKQN